MRRTALLRPVPEANLPAVARRPHSRRRFLELAGAAAGLALVAPALGQGPGQWVDIVDDNGAALVNYRIPSELDPFGLPGVLWMGPSAPDVTLFEFFDYNCPICRGATPEIEALVRATPGLRLGLAHNPILSPGSKAAARIALATLRLKGSKAAYELHTALFSGRGHVNEARALAAAADLGLTREALEAEDIRADVDRALTAQAQLAKNLGFSVTPAYALQGIAILGHPGPQSLARMVAAAKACDSVVCPPPK